LSIDPLVAQPTLCGSDNAIRLLACDPTRILANNSYARSDSRNLQCGIRLRLGQIQKGRQGQTPFDSSRGNQLRDWQNGDQRLGLSQGCESQD